MRLDLSVGQRLTIGFALMLALCTAVLVALVRSHEASLSAEREFTEVIAPLRDKAVELERAVFQLGIDTRAYLISPDDLNADTQHIAVDRVRNAHRELSRMLRDEAGLALYAPLGPLLETYVAAAEKAMQQRRHGTLGLRPERALGDSREHAVAAIRAFSEHQGMRTRAALSRMAQARERTSTEVQLAIASALALFVAIGWITARSIRAPARQLVEVARAFAVDRHLSAVLTPQLRALIGRKMQPRDEMAQLASALRGAAARIDERERMLRAQAQVAAAASGTLDKRQAADTALMAIAEHVAAEVGAVYLLVGDLLEPIAVYGIEDAAPARVGKDTVGRAAVTARPVFGDEPIGEPGIWNESAGRPNTTLALPLLQGGEVLGVLALGSFREIDESANAFLNEASTRLAAGLGNALLYERAARRADDATRVAPPSPQ